MLSAGTSADLGAHGASVSRLLLVGPDVAPRARLVERTSAHGSRDVVLAASASSLPLADSSVDAVVSTLVLCSVRNLQSALAEVCRVLRPGRHLHLVERVAADRGTAPGCAARTPRAHSAETAGHLPGALPAGYPGRVRMTFALKGSTTS